MKIVEWKMNSFFYEKVMKPIRSKQDIILLLLETLKLADNMEENFANEKGKIVICIDKMSRVFYETNNKIFSFCFPFSLKERGEQSYRIYDSLTNIEITNQMISLLISIFRENGKLKESLDNVMDFIIENANDYEYNNINDIWMIIFKLWHMEDGYIRYDCDPEHQDGDMHPLYHLDVNYSSEVTYKIGLEHSFNIDELKNILDTTKECLYLTKN